MIRIERTSCPPCLTGATTKGAAYRKKRVVESLWEMQHGKCCYSEMPIPREGHGKAVEHFRPKSVFKWQRNIWKNLLLVCPQCNGKKRNLFPEMLTDNEDETKVVFLKSPSGGKPAVIDPSSADDPEDHLTYVLDDRETVLYGQIIPRNGSRRGRVTIEVTGIDDAVFCRERFERLIDTLDVQYFNVLRAARSRDDDCLAAALRPFQAYVQSKAKFAGLAREYSRAKKLDKRFGLMIPGRFATNARTRKHK